MMGRLIFDCRDKDNNLVHFETSEADFKDLLARYEECVKVLEQKGFSLVKARSGYGKAREVVKFNGKTCPKCGKSEMWDNRAKKQSGDFSPKSPDFACKDKACGNALWPGQYEIVESA